MTAPPPSLPGGGGSASAEVAEKGLDEKSTVLTFKREAAAVIGIAGAIGAFGGFLIQVVLRQANLPVANLVKAAKTPALKVKVAAAHADWSIPALRVFLVFYVVFALTTWLVYMRKSSELGSAGI